MGKSSDLSMFILLPDAFSKIVMVSVMMSSSLCVLAKKVVSSATIARICLSMFTGESGKEIPFISGCCLMWMASASMAIM